MDIVHAWAKGASFGEVCKLNEGIFEGSIIRWGEACGRGGPVNG
jgi:superfamily II RNA helicase